MSGRKIVWEWVKRHRRWTAAGAAVGVTAVVFGLVWFQPQNLLFDRRVDEALPADVAAVTSTSGVTSPPAPSAPPTTGPPVQPPSAGPASSTTPPTTTTVGPRVVSDTRLVDVGRAGSGRVIVVERPGEPTLLRFEDLDVVNGPDLVVILSPSPLVDDRDAYDDGDFYAVAELQGNQGNQNYEIPPDVDLGDYRTVAIWCRRFNYTFNAAPLETAG